MSLILINNLLIFFLYYITAFLSLFSRIPQFQKFLPPSKKKKMTEKKSKFKLSDEILADIAYGLNNEEKCYVLRISQGFERI